MIKEKSCGAVVYKYEENEPLFLIEKMRAGHFSIPKGHVENNETEVETALREIKEETNLEVELDAEFRKVISYSPYPDCVKDVVFFIAQAKSDNLINQECEVSELTWMKYDEALNTLTFESDRQTLLSAREYIFSKQNRGE